MTGPASGPQADVATSRQGTAVGGEIGAMSDAELVRAVALRSEDALAEVYGRYGRSVHAWALGMCGPQAAEEVTLDAFLTLWRRPESFDPTRCSLASHLVAIARPPGPLGCCEKSRPASTRHRRRTAT